MRVNSGQATGAAATEDAAAALGDGLAELAQRPLFEPLRSLLWALHESDRCGLDELNALFASQHAKSSTVRELRFVAPDAAGLAYEQRIFGRGEVITRPGNWHDLFNALVWMRFPRTKRALAELHAAGLSAPGADGRRTPPFLPSQRLAARHPLTTPILAPRTH